VRPLAAAVVLVAGLVGAGCAAESPGAAVTVRDSGGALLARVPLPTGSFAVSYRNSLYGTLAEERYRVAADGRFGLVELAADQLAVLEEYYAVPGPVRAAAPDDRRDWVAVPAGEPMFADLTLAATALGERTVLVPGHAPVPLAPLVADRGRADPTVVLDVEEAR
jgi:hypothetical protein